MRHYYFYSPRGFANEYRLYWSDKPIEKTEWCRKIIETDTNARLMRITRKEALRYAREDHEYIYPYGADISKYNFYITNNLVEITDRYIVEGR